MKTLKKIKDSFMIANELSVMGIGLMSIVVKNGKILICDPILLADIFNDEDTIEYKYISERGALVDIDEEGIIGMESDSIFIGSMEVIGRCKIISNKWGIGSDSGTLVIMPIDDAPDGVVNAVRNINEGSSAIILIDHVKSGKYDVNKYVNNDSNTVIVIEYMGMA